MSEKDYLYDFNTKQLTIVDPIVEVCLIQIGKVKSFHYLQLNIYCHKRSLLMPKNSITIRKNINTLKNMAFFNSLSDKCLFPTFSPEVVKDRILETYKLSLK